MSLRGTSRHCVRDETIGKLIGISIWSYSLVTGVNTDAGSDLVFLLSGHDFSVHTRDVDSSVEARLVHAIRNGASKVLEHTEEVRQESLGVCQDVANTGLGPLTFSGPTEQ